MPKIDVKSADEIGELSGSFNIMIEAIRRRDEALKALALRDGLTGLYNLAVAERIRKRMEEEPVPFKETQPEGALTLSLGVAAMNESLRDARSLIEAADKALYKAKELGRQGASGKKPRPVRKPAMP